MSIHTRLFVYTILGAICCVFTQRVQANQSDTGSLCLQVKGKPKEAATIKKCNADAIKRVLQRVHEPRIVRLATQMWNEFLPHEIRRSSTKTDPAGEKIIPLVQQRLKQIDASEFRNEIEWIVSTYRFTADKKPRPLTPQMQAILQKAQSILSKPKINYFDLVDIALDYIHNAQPQAAIPSKSILAPYVGNHKPGDGYLKIWRGMLINSFPLVIGIPTHKSMSSAEYLKYSAFGLFPLQMLPIGETRKIDDEIYDVQRFFEHDVFHWWSFDAVASQTSFNDIEKEHGLLFGTHVWHNQIFPFWMNIRTFKFHAPREKKIFFDLLFFINHEKFTLFTHKAFHHAMTTNPQITLKTFRESELGRNYTPQEAQKAWDDLLELVSSHQGEK